MGSKTRGTTFAKWIDTRSVRWILVRRKIQHPWDWSGTAALAHVAK